MSRAPIPPKVQAARRHIVRRFRSNPTLTQVSQSVGLSMFYLHVSFRRHYGKTAKRFTTELQVAECKRLMLAGVPLGEVHSRVGLSNPSHFSARFKQVVGLTPRAWLREQGNGKSDH